MLVAASQVQFSPSTFAPLAVGFFGLGTGYLIYFWQELAGLATARREGQPGDRRLGYLDARVHAAPGRDVPVRRPGVVRELP